MFNVCFTYGSDDPGHSDFTNEQQIAAINTKLFGLTVFNQSTGDLFVRIYDASAAVHASASARYILPVYAGSYLPIGWAAGQRYGNGVYVEAVSAVAASAAVTGTPVKFTWDKMDGPLH